MNKHERETIAAQLGVNGGDELAALRAELASVRGELADVTRDRGELRELLAGATEELAGQRGELDAVRFDLAQAQARERVHVTVIAELEGKLIALVGTPGPGESTGKNSADHE